MPDRAGRAAFATVALYDALVLQVVDIGDAGTNSLDLWGDDGGPPVERAEDGVALFVHTELADPYGLKAGHVEPLKVEAHVGLCPGAVDLVGAVHGGVKRANVGRVVGDHRLAEGHELCHACSPVQGIRGLCACRSILAFWRQRSRIAGGLRTCFNSVGSFERSATLDARLFWLPSE